jgi:purine nucleosidase/pyrimidine-specific ribonucleoside hydrolase
MPFPVLIDTDPGIDDALALILALRSPECSVEAITTVAGNAPVERCTRNVFRVLEAAKPARRPLVGRGVATPLVRPLVTASDVHGEDGLGDLDRLRSPDGTPRYREPAITLSGLDGPDLILEMAGRFPDELTIVALGPLTNLALAIQQDQGRMRRIRRVVVMGGAISVPGNITPAAEFNFYVDPEAAAYVLGGGLPIELVPLDVTRLVVLEEPALAARTAFSPDPLERFIADFTERGFDFAAETGSIGITLHDPLAVGVALDPSLVAFEPLHVEVECSGKLTRGVSLADRRPVPSDRKAPPNCRVATSVDAPRFLSFFLDRLCPVSS